MQHLVSAAPALRLRPSFAQDSAPTERGPTILFLREGGADGFPRMRFQSALGKAAFDESAVSLMKFTEIPVFPLASDGVAGVYFGELKEFRMSASSAPPRPPQGRH